MDEPYEPLTDRLEIDVRALCPPERAWREPHVADVVLPDEDPVAFVLCRVRLEEEVQPVGDLEREAVLTITAARWRRRRIERIYRDLLMVAAGPDGGPVRDRERRARLAACRAERAAELRIEYQAAAEIRRSKKAGIVELKDRVIPETQAMRAQAWEHELQLDAARRATREAGERARAAEARLDELSGTGGAAAAPVEASAGDPALHPTEDNMKPWLVLMGEGGAAATDPAPPAEPIARRLARKLAGDGGRRWSG